MRTIPTLLCDFYKLSHREQYPVGTEVVYSTWTPRSNKYHPSAKKVVAFGAQKSNKGVVAVVDDGKGGIMCIDQLPFDNDAPDLMRPIFLNGKLLIDESLTTVRSRCLSSI